VLLRSEEILRSRNTNLAAFNDDLEKQKGLEGFSRKVGELDTVSVQTGEVDAAKTGTLDEISKIVTNIKELIMAKHNKLKPQIVAFKAERAKADDVEADYQRKKSAYERTLLGLNSERLSLEKDVESNTGLLKEEESSYHMINCMAVLTSARHLQMTSESSNQSGKSSLSSEFKSYAELIGKSIRDHEQLAKKLLKDQKEVKESHESHISRRKAYAQLKALMAAKLKSAAAARAGAAAAGSAAAVAAASGSIGADGENILRMGAEDHSGGADRLLIGDG